MVKIILTESQFNRNILKEYYNQLRIPFPDNKVYQEFMYWITDTGHYGQLPPSKITFNEGVKSGIPVASKWATMNDDVSVDNFMKQCMRASKFWHPNEGDGPIINNKGQMYVERGIGLPKLYANASDTDFNFNQLLKDYQNNVGGCWAWRKGQGKDYCDEIGGDTVVLHGYIRLDDIDWVETVYCNCDAYGMRNECEVRAKPNAKVEVFSITNDVDADTTLKRPIIVNSTYFGNNNKFIGNYAKLYDAKTKEKKYIDRDGNIDTDRNIVKKSIARGTYRQIYNIPNGNRIINVLGAYYFIDKQGNPIIKNQIKGINIMSDKFASFDISTGQSVGDTDKVIYDLFTGKPITNENVWLVHKIYGNLPFFKLTLGEWDENYIFNAETGEFLNSQPFDQVTRLLNYKPNKDHAFVMITIRNDYGHEGYNIMDMRNGSFINDSWFEVIRSLGNGFFGCLDLEGDKWIFDTNSLSFTREQDDE